MAVIGKLNEFNSQINEVRKCYLKSTEMKCVVISGIGINSIFESKASAKLYLCSSTLFCGYLCGFLKIVML